MNTGSFSPSRTLAARALERGDGRGVGGAPAQAADRGDGCGAVGHAVVEDLGQAQADFIDLGAGDFQHFQLHHDLGLGDIEVLHEAVDQADHLGRVAHHHQVEALVDEDVAGLGHGAHQGLGLLGIGVGQEVALGDGVEHVALLLLCGGEDEHGVVVEQLVAELLGAQDDAQGLVHRDVAQEDGGLVVAAHVLVEDEVEVGRAGQGLEHALERGFAEFQRDGLGADRQGLRGLFAGLVGADVFHAVEQAAGTRVVGLLSEQLAQRGFGALEGLGLDGGLGVVEEAGAALQAVHLDAQGLGARVLRRDLLHAGEDALELVGLAGVARGIGLA